MSIKGISIPGPLDILSLYYPSSLTIMMILISMIICSAIIKPIQNNHTYWIALWVVGFIWVCNFWIMYGWPAGILALLCIMMGFPAIYSDNDGDTDNSTKNVIVEVERPEVSQLSATHNAISTARFKDNSYRIWYASNHETTNGVTIYPLPTIVKYSSGFYDEWASVFLEKISNAIPKGKHINPALIKNAGLHLNMDSALIAFCLTNGRGFGLYHKNICVLFSHRIITAIAVVENICRNSVHHSMMFILDDEAIEISFDLRELDMNKFYQFVIALAEAWQVRLTNKYFNNSY